jgi:hypothetical protein
MQLFLITRELEMFFFFHVDWLLIKSALESPLNGHIQHSFSQILPGLNFDSGATRNIIVCCRWGLNFIIFEPLPYVAFINFQLHNFNCFQKNIDGVFPALIAFNVTALLITAV